MKRDKSVISWDRMSSDENNKGTEGKHGGKGWKERREKHGGATTVPSGWLALSFSCFSTDIFRYSCRRLSRDASFARATWRGKNRVYIFNMHMPMYIYIYIYIYTHNTQHIHTHLCIYIYIHTYINIFIHTLTYIYKHIFTHTLTYMHIHI
jgi:hypothetical protein